MTTTKTKDTETRNIPDEGTQQKHIPQRLGSIDKTSFASITIAFPGHGTKNKMQFNGIW